ncbi:hypothetical protein LINPERPRIM_LOCUS33358 [Linum perenne]
MQHDTVSLLLPLILVNALSLKLGSQLLSLASRSPGRLDIEKYRYRSIPELLVLSSSGVDDIRHHMLERLTASVIWWRGIGNFTCFTCIVKATALLTIWSILAMDLVSVFHMISCSKVGLSHLLLYKSELIITSRTNSQLITSPRNPALPTTHGRSLSLMTMGDQVREYNKATTTRGNNFNTCTLLQEQEQ